MGSFATNDGHSKRWHQPVRVPTNKRDIFGAAREMVEDLSGWTVREVNDEDLSITCERKNGALGGTSTIVIRVSGPDGIPNSETNCSSDSTGALMSRDKANVAEFVQKFWMRVS